MTEIPDKPPPPQDSLPPELQPSGSFFHSFGSLAFVAASAFTFNIILTRILSIEDIGHIRVVRTVLEFCAIPASLGVAAYLARHVADMRATAEDRRRMVGTASALAAGFALVVALAVFAALRLGMVRDEAARRTLDWLIFLLPAFALYNAFIGYLQGAGRIKELAAAQAMRSAIMLVSGVGLAAALGFFGWSISRVITEAGATTLIFLLFLRRSLGNGGELQTANYKLQKAPTDPSSIAQSALPIPESEFQISDLKFQISDSKFQMSDLKSRIPNLGSQSFGSFLSFGAFAALTQTLDAAVLSVDVLALDYFRNDPAEVAQYGIAMLMFSTALLLPFAFAQSQFYKWAAHGHDRFRTWDNLKHFSGVMLVIAAPAAIVAYLLAPAIARIFGPAYVASGLIFQWLLPAFIIKSAGTVANDLVVASGRIRLHFLSALATGAVNVALNLWLIPRWGVQGAIWATTAAFALRALLSTLILASYRWRPASA